MATRLDAIAAEYFLALKRGNGMRRRSGTDVVGSKRTEACVGTEVEASSSSTVLSPHEFDTHKPCESTSNGDKSSTPLALLDSTHAFPPLLLYFECLPTEREAIPTVCATQPGVPGLVRTSASAAGSTQCEVAWQRARQFGSDSNDMSFSAGWRKGRRGTNARGQTGASISGEGNYARPRNDFWTWCDGVDVFANFAQPPLSVVYILYEVLDKRHQRGLHAISALVEKCNNSFHRERWVTASSVPAQRSAFDSVNGETIIPGNGGAAAASTPTPTPALRDGRSSIVHSVNNLLRDLITRGDRVLALHIIIRVATWRFCGRNERVTVLFNHIRACLPATQPSTATLAMEAWAQLHAIGASSTVYLKVATEMLRLACSFINDVSMRAGQVSGFIIIHHIAQWPDLLYRALLHDERDQLLLVIWESLVNTHQQHIRELAAVVLRSLFILDIVRGSHSSMRELVLHAVLQIQPSSRQVCPLSPSSSVSPHPAEAVRRVSGATQPVASATLSDPFSGVDETTDETAAKKMASARHPSPRPSRGRLQSRAVQLKRFIFSLGRSVVNGLARGKVPSVGVDARSSESRKVSEELPLESVTGRSLHHMVGESPQDEAHHIVSPLSLPVVDGRHLCSPVMQTDLIGKRFRSRLTRVVPSRNDDIVLRASTLVIGAFVSALRSCSVFLDVPPRDGGQHCLHGAVEGPHGAAGLQSTGRDATVECSLPASGSGEGIRPAEVPCNHGGADLLCDATDAPRPTFSCGPAIGCAGGSAVKETPVFQGMYRNTASSRDQTSPRHAPMHLEGRSCTSPPPKDLVGIDDPGLWMLVPVQPLLLRCLSYCGQSRSGSSWYMERLIPVLTLYGLHTLQESDVCKALEVLLGRAKALHRKAASSKRQPEACVRNPSLISSVLNTLDTTPTTDESEQVYTGTDLRGGRDAYAMSLVNLALFLSVIAIPYPQLFERTFVSHIYPILFYALQQGAPTYCPAANVVLALLVHNFPATIRARLQPFVERLTSVLTSMPFSTQMLGAAEKICGVYGEMRSHCCFALLQRIAGVLTDTEPLIVHDIKNSWGNEPARERICTNLLLNSVANVKKKIICFRVLHTVCMECEGAALFFLEVCTPYLHHQDVVLRRACVQSCVRLLLSDCFISKAGKAVGTPLSDTVASGVEQVTSCSVRRLRNGDLGAEPTGSHGSPRGNKSERDGVRVSGAETYPFLAHVFDSVNAGNVGNASQFFCNDDDAWSVGGTEGSLDRVRECSPFESTDYDVVFTCERHVGRSHNNILREVLHRLVEVALCDPDEVIRHTALISLTKETDQFLYTHKEVVDLIFAALSDEYAPNRLQAARILRRLGHYVPMDVYPRLRKVFLLLIQDFQSTEVDSHAKISNGVQQDEDQVGNSCCHRHTNDRVPNSRMRTDVPIATAGANECGNKVRYSADQMMLLFELVQSLTSFIPIYLDAMLQLLQRVLVPHDVLDRGTVITALHMVSFLMDETTRVEWPKFEVLLMPLSQQLVLRDNDTNRLHVAICTLQKLIQYVVIASPFDQRDDLKVTVESLYSLLYRRPPIGTELSLSVVKLLGTISAICTDQKFDDPQSTPLLTLATLNGSRGNLGAFVNTYQLCIRSTPGYAAFLPVVPSGGSFHGDEKNDAYRLQVSEYLWPDVILRVLLRTLFEALENIIAFTDEELQACLQATVEVLRSSNAPSKLQLYLPPLLSVLAGLLKRTDEDAPLRVYATESIAELVKLAGRSIAPMFDLLVVFLSEHLMSSSYTLPGCCKLIIILCKASPDLVQEHCERFVSLLLGKLMHYVEMATSSQVPADGQIHRRQENHQVVPHIADDIDSTPQGIAARSYMHGSVIDVVLRAILALLPVADGSTVHYACLMLSQILRNAGGVSEPLRTDEEGEMDHTIDTTVPTGLSGEIIQNIVQALVDLLESFDLTAISMFVVETALLLLRLYAKAHEIARFSFIRRQKEESARGNTSLSPHGTDIHKTQDVPETAPENISPRNLEPFGTWFARSPLSRLVAEEITNDGMGATYRFPFNEVTSCWEAEVEMDLLACVFLVCGRCKLPAVSYELVVGEYIEQRFRLCESVRRFFGAVSSPKYRVYILYSDGQKTSPPIRMCRDEPTKVAEPRCGSAGVIHPQERPLTPTEAERVCNNRYQRDKNPVIERNVPPRSVPIPLGSVRLPSSMRSSLMASPCRPQHKTSARDVSVFGSRESLRGVANDVHIVPMNSMSPLTLSAGNCLVPGVESGSYEFEEANGSRRRQPPSQVGGLPFSVCDSVNNLSEATPPRERKVPVHNVSPVDMTADDVSYTEDEDADDEKQRFFKLHGGLTISEWRPWFELFCTILVESSEHVCVNSCTSLVRRHFSIFSSDIFPTAFLSHLASCDTAGMVRWLELLHDFVRVHDHVPHAIAAELARLVYGVRVNRGLLFLPSSVKTVDAFFTSELVTVLAEQALNAPLVLICAEEKLLSKFCWRAATTFYKALEDLNCPYHTHILCKRIGFRAAVRELMGDGNVREFPQTGDKGTANVLGGNPASSDIVLHEDCNQPFPWERAEFDNNAFGGYPAVGCAESVLTGNSFSWRREGIKGVEKCMPPPVVLEFGWPQAALSEYLSLIYSGLSEVQKTAVRRGSFSTVPPRGLSRSFSSADVVGAMRCYMRVYDFESILRLWGAVKGTQFLHQSCGTPVDERTHEIERSLLRTMWPCSQNPTGAYIADFVVSAAKSLSRWDIVEELCYTDFLPEAAGDFHNVCSYRDFPFYKQMEISRAAALVASKRYTEAKGVLASLRAALRDSYAVFYTENTRLKTELSIMFQEISDLEEGINAIDLKRTTVGYSNDGGAGCSLHPRTTTTQSMNNSACASPDFCGEGKTDWSPAYAGVRSTTDQHHGRWRKCLAYTEATVRRLQNIAGRLLPEHSTVLQRFEMIALRSTLVPPGWQLQNILILCERITEEGKPRRALQAIEHFLNVPITDTDEEECCEYRSSLLLEKYRIGLQHLYHFHDLQCLLRDIVDRMGVKIDRPPREQALRTQLSKEDLIPLSCSEHKRTVNREYSELVLLSIVCQRKIARAKHRELDYYNPSNLSSSLNTLVTEPLRRTANGFLHDASGSVPPLVCRLGSGNNADDVVHPVECPRSVADIVDEYRRVENVVSTHEATASIWCEFGLLLFDVCMAIYKEWGVTREPKTLKNFCVQSKKAISALQKAVTIWNTQTFNSITGVGWYLSTSVRRLRHSRTALPIVHLLLKSLHLSMKLYDVLSDEEHLTSVNSAAIRASVAPINKGGNSGGDDSDRWHATSDTSCANLADDAPDVSESWSRDVGFLKLDFSPGMHLHWGCALPFLVNAAARYDKLKDAVRDMCSHSQAMLYQCVYQLVSTFEHNCSAACETAGSNMGQDVLYDVPSASCVSNVAAGASCSQIPADEAFPGDGVLKRRFTHDVRNQKRRQCDRPADILSVLAAVSEGHRAVIDQTLQFCKFVREGETPSLILGICALPVPLWNLQRYMAMMYASNEKGRKFCERYGAGSVCGTMSTLGAGLCNSSVELQCIQQIRRLVGPPYAEGVQEEVFVLFLSDGTMPRFHRLARENACSAGCDLKQSVNTRPLRHSSSASPCDARGSGSGLRCRSPFLFELTNQYPLSTLEGASTEPPASPSTRIAAGLQELSDAHEFAGFTAPVSAMESVISCLLGHLPVRYLRRPLVLPLGLRDFITQLPNIALTSSQWQMSLPPSLQAKCAAFMGGQPLSLLHVLEEYNKRLVSDWSVDRKSNHGVTRDCNEHSNGTHTPLRQSTPTETGRRTSLAHHLRKHDGKPQRLTRYEQLLSDAFDWGRVQPLRSFIRKNLGDQPCSANQFPRPLSQIKELYGGLEDLFSSFSDVGGGATSDDGIALSGDMFLVPLKQNEYNKGGFKQVDESLLAKVRMLILQQEAPLYSDALRLTLHTVSTDASKWLNIVQTFAGELAEYSMVEYLLDITHRECATFFVDTATGHVATHCLGAHSLQNRRRLRHSAGCQNWMMSDKWEPAVVEPEAKTVEGLAAMPSASPFPCTDPTIFRLTGCLVSVLPLKCPYGVFLSSATQCLFSILRYQTDLVGIVKYGVEDLRCFAWGQTSPHQGRNSDSLQSPCFMRGQGTTSERGEANQGVESALESLNVSQQIWALTKGSYGQISTWVAHSSVEGHVGTPGVGLDSEGPLPSVFAGAAFRRSSPCDALESPDSQIPTFLVQDAGFGGGNVVKHELFDTSLDVAEEWGNDMKQQAGTTDPKQLMKKISPAAASGVTLNNFVQQGAQQRPFGHSFPKLFDCASILVKLNDDLLPMRGELQVEVFVEPKRSSIEGLFDALRSGQRGQDLKVFSPVSNGSDGEKAGEGAALETKGVCVDDVPDRKVRRPVQSVEDRVVQLINAAVNRENLIGTTYTPHRWCSWAPHW